MFVRFMETISEIYVLPEEQSHEKGHGYSLFVCTVENSNPDMYVLGDFLKVLHEARSNNFFKNVCSTAFNGKFIIHTRFSFSCDPSDICDIGSGRGRPVKVSNLIMTCFRWVFFFYCMLLMFIDKGSFRFLKVNHWKENF